MAVDNTKVSKELVLQEGMVITTQGQQTTSLNLLHSGTIEVLYSDQQVNPQNETEAVRSSLRLYQLSGDYTFSEYGLIHNSHALYTVRAVRESKISIYPFTKDQILALPRSNPNMAIYILKSLFRKIHLLIDTMNAINRNYRDLLVLSDNLKIITADIAGRMPESGGLKDLISSMKSLSLVYSKNHGPAADPSDPSFLTTDHGQYIDKNYDESLADVKSVIDYEMVTFFLNFLKVDGPILSNQLQTLPAMFKFPLENLSLIQNILNQTIYEYRKLTIDELRRIYGTEGSLGSLWLSANQAQMAALPIAAAGTNAALMEKLNQLQSHEATIRVQPEQNLINRLQVLFSQLGQAAPAAAAQKVTVPGGAPAAASFEISPEARQKLGQLKGSVAQILKFSAMNEEERTAFLKLLKNFKSLSDKLDISPEARRARFQVGRAFWNLYYRCFMKAQEDQANVPLPVDLLLRFGFLDETLLDEQRQLFILSATDPYRGSMDIISTHDWLKKILAEEKTPSITEMGLTFDKFLLEEAKSKTHAEMQAITGNPEVLKRFKTEFEVNQMITSCARVCSESLSTSFPILINEILTGDINKAYLYRQQIEDVIADVQKIDFQVFNREVLVKTKYRVEIIEKGVTPEIIILPTVGSRIMMWQDLEGTNKRSKSRFTIPQFFFGDLRKQLILALGRFRWEICKTQKGPQWADAIEGGLTGYYFDYISFYKKNPNLSDEAKEKVEEHVKSFRSNRERFAQDYLTYIEFESKGIAKLNKVLRDMLYRIVPLTKEVRSRLKLLPVYEPLEQKYTNVLNRKLKDLEIKFRKYEKDAEGMPPELTEYIEMLKR